jgi:hypothetical protein
MRLAFHNAAVGQSSSNGAVFDKLIEWHSGSPLVHVELVMDSTKADRWMLKDPDTRARCYSAVPDLGVRWATVDITQPWWTVVALPAITPAGMWAANDVVDTCLGQKYDWIGILGFATPWGAHDDNDKFCSEVCTLVLQAAGFFAGVKSWRTSPAALYELALELLPRTQPTR